MVSRLVANWITGFITGWIFSLASHQGVIAGLNQQLWCTIGEAHCMLAMPMLITGPHANHMGHATCTFIIYCIKMIYKITFSTFFYKATYVQIVSIFAIHCSCNA